MNTLKYIFFKYEKLVFKFSICYDEYNFFNYSWPGRYLPDRSNEKNYGSISKIVAENEDFAVYSAPKQKKNMVTMGSMDINSTCDDGKVFL